MICFICATPYHVLITLNLALTTFKNRKKYLVLFNHFKNYADVAEICEKYNIFEKIVIIKHKDLGWIEKWDHLYHSIFFYSSLSTLFRTNKFDKVIIFLIYPSIVSFIIKKVLKRNDSCEICIGDDGLGSYLTFDIYKPNQRALFLLKLLRREKYYKLFSSIYLLKPELLTYKSSIKVERIDGNGFNDSKFQTIVNQIFGNYKIPCCDYLFLQQPYEQCFGELKLNSVKQENLFKQINSFIKNRRAFIKLHPRTKKFIDLEHCENLNQSLPLELMLTSKINNTTIITIDSTAAFTPYLLYGYKPRILLLYELCGTKPFTNNMNRFVGLFTKEYSLEGGQIFVPKTIDEMKDLLKGSISD